MLSKLKKSQQGPIGDFLLAYTKQTKRQTIKLSTFSLNLYNAYNEGKFGLPQMVQYPCNISHTHEIDEPRTTS